jgi:gliding motility-associated-like protein
LVFILIFACFLKVKMKFIRELLFIFLVVNFINVESQTYLMSGNSITTCSGTWYDPGGNANYSNNQDITQTIYSTGNHLSVNFSAFSLATGDYLYVYDGNTISSPLLSTRTGTTLPPELISSGNCLTFRFVSNASGVSSGWTAAISCASCIMVSSLAGSPCASDGANPFCTDENPYGISYPSGTTGNANTFFSGGTPYGCLSSAPRPAWYYMRINDPGNLLIYIQQISTNGSGIDVDFACWGPFAAANQTDFMDFLCCSYYDFTITSHLSHRPWNGDHTNNTGGYPFGNLVDCSYSELATEWCYIPNAQQGEFYLLLITNYDGGNGTITFNTVASSTTSTTDCNLLAQASNNGPLCEGATLQLMSNNSVAGITYQWSGPNGWTSSLQNPVIANVSSSMAGDYTLIMGNGISFDTAVTTVIINTVPNIVVTPNNPVLCRGDNVTVSVSGAASYHWSNNLGNGAIVNVAPTAGTTYTVTGTNGNCSTSASLVVTVNSLPVINVSATPSTICEGNSAILVASGANTYIWSTGDSDNSVTVFPSGTTTYYVTGTSTSGCTSTAGTTVNISPAVNTSISGNNIICSGQSTTLTAFGGGSYRWNTGETASSITVSPDISTFYFVTVTSTNSCPDTGSIQVVVNQLPEVTINLPENEICPNLSEQSINVFISGGTPAYHCYWTGNGIQNSDNDTVTFLINPGNCNYQTDISVTVTDQNNCVVYDTATLIIRDTLAPVITGTILSQNADVADSQYRIPNLMNETRLLSLDNCTIQEALIISQNPEAGSSVEQNTVVTIMVSDGCQNSVLLNVPIVVPDELTCSVSAYSDVTCFGESNGSATLAVQGGTPPYTYQWNSVPVQYGNSAVNLPAGQYNVTVTDINNFQTTSTVFISQPIALMVSGTKTDATCNVANGSIDLTVSGGTTPYQFLWSNNATTSDISNLDENEYSVVISDANNCSVTYQDSVIGKPSPQLYLENAVNETCNQSNASIKVYLEGGTAPVNYLWSIGDNNTDYLADISEGVYVVTVEDADGCLDSLSIYISNSIPVISTREISPSHCDRDDGWIILNILGGSGVYDIRWNAVQDYEGNRGFNLSPGNYSITVDDSICAVDYNFRIDEIEGPTACFTVSKENNILINAPVAFRDCSQMADSWYWNFGDGSYSNSQFLSHSFPEAGVYRVMLTVANQYDCLDSSEMQLTVNESAIVYIPNAFTPDGNGLNDAFKPVMTYVSANDYLMQIYDRWGNLVFSSTDINKGWDGTYNGNTITNSAVFHYVIYYKDVAGKSFYKTGYVTLTP